MTAFYCDTGAVGIAQAVSLLGLPGGKSWEKSLSNHSSKMCKLITSVVNGVVKRSLEGEITATICENLINEKYSEEKIKKETQAFFVGDNENVPYTIRTCGLAVSYGMG